MTNWKAGAQTAGRWHPKLMLLQGPEGALAAIGSGNLTLAGGSTTQSCRPAFCRRSCPRGALPLHTGTGLPCDDHSCRVRLTSASPDGGYWNRPLLPVSGRSPTRHAGNLTLHAGWHICLDSTTERAQERGIIRDADAPGGMESAQRAYESRYTRE